MQIKQVWCEVETKDGKTQNTMVPIEVFIYHRDKIFTDNDMGMYTDKQVDDLKNWEPK